MSLRNYWTIFSTFYTANSDYQDHSMVLYPFVPNKSFSELLDILVTATGLEPTTT